MHIDEQTVTPYVLTQGSAAEAIAFYRSVFDAEESGARFTDAAGKIGHAEIKIGNSRIMLADEAPPEHRFSPILFHLLVVNADATFAKALAAGATQTRAIADQPFGERSGVILDPFGHSWMVSQRVESISNAELQKRVGDQYSIT